MLFFNTTLDANIYLFTYMLIYNISLTIFFWTIFNVINTQFKTLNSFNGFSFNSFYVIVLTILLFSMAGVPPFIGFFSKLFIITLLVNNAFFILYTLFFIILLIGLYFYVQNIRFLHSTNFSSLNYSYITNERHVLVYYYFTITFLFFFIFGTFYIDDFILLMYWLFN